LPDELLTDGVIAWPEWQLMLLDEERQQKALLVGRRLSHTWMCLRKALDLQLILRWNVDQCTSTLGVLDIHILRANLYPKRHASHLLSIPPMRATLLLAASLVMHSSRVATLQEIPQDADIYKQGDGRAAYDDRMSSVDIGQHDSV
jgi:hypothetical protein